MLQKSSVILCPLEEILFYDWSDFSKAIPSYQLEYFKHRIYETIVVNKQLNPNNLHIIGTVFWEYLPELFVEKLQQIINWDKNNNIEFSLILNEDYRNITTSLDCDIEYIDYFLLRTYWFTIKNQKQAINRTWNFNSNKSLLLTGKSNKIHRIGLVYELYKKRILRDNFIWSLFVIDGPVKDECYKIIQQLDDTITPKKFKQFLSYTNSSAEEDGIDFIIGPENHTFYSGFPYDESLFSSTNFSIISESYFDNNRNGANNSNRPFITEKTWKAIVNNHPFMIAGVPGTNNLLNEYGFITFDAYIKYPYEYGSNKQRLLNIIKNIEYFQQHCNENRHNINADINHNINLFNKIVSKNLNIIMGIISKNNLNITNNEFLSLINNVENDKNEYHILKICD